MPQFTIELPNGKRIDVEADDENAALTGAQGWYAKNGTSTDLSALSDEQLRAMYAAPDLTKMSDQDLKAAYAARTPDTSITGALAQGASDLVRGVGKTVKEYVAPDAGKSIEAAGSALANPRYKSALEQFSQPEDGADNHVLGRDWSKLPRVLVEQAPGVLTDLAVSRLMKRFGPIGQVAGGMASHGLRIAGNEAQKRATARTGDEGAEPTFEDKAVGLGISRSAGRAQSNRPQQGPEPR